jgi:hypothetical protein
VGNRDRQSCVAVSEVYAVSRLKTVKNSDLALPEGSIAKRRGAKVGRGSVKGD